MLRMVKVNGPVQCPRADAGIRPQRVVTRLWYTVVFALGAVSLREWRAKPLPPLQVEQRPRPWADREALR